MLLELYFQCFVAICLGLVAWGLIRTERIYQYPFFMGCIFMTFLVPQASALINNPLFVSTTALERVLLMSSLCAGMCLLGYRLKPDKKLLSRLNIKIDKRKLVIVAIFLTIMGYFFNFLLFRTPIQTGANGNLTGPATIFIFFSQVIYIGFTIFLFQLLKHPSVINFSGTLIAAIPILQTIIFGGRRQPTMTFLITIGLSMWIVHRLAPPRWLVIILLISGFYIIPVVGALRGNFWTLVFNQNWDLLWFYAQNSFASVLEGNTLELRNAALMMDAVEVSGSYQFGTGYWDSLVFQYVPGQIVGFDFKNSLQFNPQGFRTTLVQLYGYNIPSGTTPTGIGDSFLQFGYFGCLSFGLIGYLFKNLWVSSMTDKSLISVFLMIGLISPAMLGITHGIGRFLQEAVFQIGVVSLVAYYASYKTMK